MSIQAVAWALDIADGIDPTAKLILVAMADTADLETGLCFPSISRLAKRALCSKRTVSRKITELQEAGFITVERRLRHDGSQTSNAYRLIMEPDEIEWPKPHESGDDNLTPPHDNLTPPHDRAMSPPHDKVVSSPPMTQLCHAINHQLEPSDKLLSNDNSKKAKPAAILATVLSQAQAAAVVEHRRAIKAPLTKRGAELLVKQFSQWPKPDEAADEMIQRGWRGFKAEWMERDQHGTYSRSSRTPINGEFRSSVSDEQARKVAASWTPEELERRKAALKAEREQW